MVDNKASTRLHISLGDRAASGLLQGILAGAFIAAVLFPAGLLAGNTWRQALNVFYPFGQDAPLQGLLLHLGVSAVYGSIFGLVQPLIPQRLPGWLAGLGYGVLLFALAEWVLLPQSQFGMSALPPLALLLGHGVYGLVLGFRRQE